MPNQTMCHNKVEDHQMYNIWRVNKSKLLCSIYKMVTKKQLILYETTAKLIPYDMSKLTRRLRPTIAFTKNVN